MLLCVDIGNTSIVLGLYDEKKLVQSFRLQTNIYQTSDEYAIKILSILDNNKINRNDIDGIMISSVVPQLDSVFSALCKKYFEIDAKFVVPGIRSGINIRIDNPKELGADLLVGAVGAVNKYGAPIIVIDMGTAITLVYVNKDKELLGGAILPGLKTSFNALFQKASKLEEVGIARPNKVIGRDTISSIQSGMTYGLASMLDGIIKKMKEEQGEASVVLTGGEARFIITSMEEEAIYDENLLLDGLRILYNKNK